MQYESLTSKYFGTSPAVLSEQSAYSALIMVHVCKHRGGCIKFRGGGCIFWY